MTEDDRLMAVIATVFDRTIAFNRVFVRIAGSVNAGLFLSQMWYWTRRLPKDRDGWLHKTAEQWEEETGLSKREQQTARGKLVALGVLQEKRKPGLVATLWFKIDKRRIVDIIKSLPQEEKPVE